MEKLRANILPQIKGKKIVAALSLATGVLLIGAGFVGLTAALFTGFDAAFPGGSWNAVFNLLMGIIVTLNYQIIRKSTRYYVQIEKDRVEVFLPEEKSMRIIPVSKIKDIDIEFTDILLKLESEVIVIKLGFMSFSQVRELKERFEELKLRVGGMNVDELE